MRRRGSDPSDLREWAHFVDPSVVGRAFKSGLGPHETRRIGPSLELNTPQVEGARPFIRGNVDGHLVQGISVAGVGVQKTPGRRGFGGDRELQTARLQAGLTGPRREPTAEGRTARRDRGGQRASRAHRGRRSVFESGRGSSTLGAHESVDQPPAESRAQSAALEVSVRA